MLMHGTKTRVCGPVRWGLCLDRSCRCTVQGHRRLARVQAMCVHSCVSWPRAGLPPSAPSAPAELTALFLRCGRPRGLLAPGPGRLGPAVIGGRVGSSAPSRAGGAGSAPVTGAGGRGGGWGGARPSIFCYYSVMGLLGRPPICHRPRSLITGICHHFPLRQCHQRC